MLYFKALLDGLAEMPSADASLRAQLEARAQAEGWAALHAELRAVDPEWRRVSTPMTRSA